MIGLSVCPAQALPGHMRLLMVMHVDKSLDWSPHHGKNNKLVSKELLYMRAKLLSLQILESGRQENLLFIRL